MTATTRPVLSAGNGRSPGRDERSSPTGAGSVGAVVGWGNQSGFNDYGQTDVPAGNDFVAIAAGLWHSLALRAEGSIYVTGKFGGTMTFPTASGPITLTSAGGLDAFVLKFDDSGTALWARRIGSATASDSAAAIAVAGDGSVYVSGAFTGTAEFGTLTPLTAIAGSDNFLTKLNSDTGDFLWARQRDWDVTPWDVMTEAGGDVFIVGGNVARYDPNGNLLWSQERVENVGALYEDPTGKDYLYIAEVYGSLPDGQRTLRKLDGDTGIEVWNKTGLPQTGNGNILAIATDTSGHVYVTGSYEGLDDVDPGIGTF